MFWMILAVYVVGWFVSVPLIARFVIDDGLPTDPLDYAIATAGGMLLALFWPLLIPGAYFYRQIKKGDGDE